MGLPQLTKIIINGGNAARLLDTACQAIQYLDAGEAAALPEEEIIRILNRMEEDAARVQNLILNGVKYKGARGKLLDSVQ